MFQVQIEYLFYQSSYFILCSRYLVRSVTIRSLANVAIWPKRPQIVESYWKRGLKWTDARIDLRVTQTQWRYRNICIIISRYNGNYTALMWHMWWLEAGLIKPYMTKTSKSGNIIFISMRVIIRLYSDINIIESVGSK